MVVTEDNCQVREMGRGGVEVSSGMFVITNEATQLSSYVHRWIHHREYCTRANATAPHKLSLGK